MPIAQALLPEFDHETLAVYLRLNDVPVPALYRPSADEAG